MILPQIRRSNFFLNPCSCISDFRPFSMEFYDSLEILMLMEAFFYSFARYEGPMPITRSFPPWSYYLTNHAHYFSNSECILLANYWDGFTRWFWENTVHQPLLSDTLLVVKQNLTDLFFQHAKLQVSASTSARIVQYYCTDTLSMRSTTLVSTFRTDFSRPDIIANTTLHGLIMRERFDAKQRPRTKWNNENYLRRHAQLLRRVQASSSDTSQSSSSSVSQIYITSKIISQLK